MIFDHGGSGMLDDINEMPTQHDLLCQMAGEKAVKAAHGDALKCNLLTLTLTLTLTLIGGHGLPRRSVREWLPEEDGRGHRCVAGSPCPSFQP